MISNCVYYQAEAQYGCWYFSWDGESSNVGSNSLFWDWAIQIDGRAVVALVTQELGVQFLVSL